MKFIKVNEDGKIIATNDEINKAEINDWLTISEHAYDLITKGEYVINKYKLPSIINSKKINQVDIDEDELILYTAQELISLKIRTNTLYCQMQIDKGITYNGIQYTFTGEDRIKYIENIYLLQNNMLKNYFPINSNHGLKFVEIGDFIEIYNKQLKNKFYFELCIDEFNKYITTLTNYENINSIEKGTELPFIKNSIEEKMKMFEL